MIIEKKFECVQKKSLFSLFETKRAVHTSCLNGSAECGNNGTIIKDRKVLKNGKAFK
jgi:hypothetical protein